MLSRHTPSSPTVADSLREYGRGLTGGLIFSLPLLYTMEVWWAGLITRPERMLGYLAFVFALLLGYNHFVGIRRDAHRIEVFIDSIEELGLGVITATVVLYLMGRIHSHSSFDEVVGQILVEAGIVAIGFSVGTAQLGAGDEGESGEGEGDDNQEGVTFGGQLLLALCGAVLFAANVAPTEEIMMIAIEATPVRIIGLGVLALALGACVLYFVRFASAKRVSRAETHLDIVAGTVVTYAIAIVASAAILWFFGRFDGASTEFCVAQTIVLSLPAALGASAGRLLLQT